MSGQAISVFDTTLNEANKWLRDVEEAMGRPDRQVAYHALRGVLFALRDRLTVEEAFDLSAQLPMLVRGIYFEGYRPTGKPLKMRHREEFVEYVNREFKQIEPVNPEKAIEAVFTVLDHHIDGGTREHVRHQLPKDIRNMWPEPVGA